ncbi:hypothetical protein AGMMS49983_09720 [Clostridia bacterium]|nr:hypothetical protein AGMMS49983_09720 [Clostridia bacterium]
MIDRKDIAQAYMVFGGILYYLNDWDGRYGLPQNMDRIIFHEDAPLKDEFESDYAEKLRNKLFAFGNETRTTKTPHLTFVTTYGVKQNRHSNMVQSEVTLDALFTPVFRG